MAAATPKPLLLLSGANTSTTIPRSSLPRLLTRWPSATTCTCADRRVSAVAAFVRPGGARVAKLHRASIPPRAAASPSAAAAPEGMSDPELKLVLELATDEELMEIEEILYGTRFYHFAEYARSVIRGWRPSYRDVLLGVRRKLEVQCSSKLCTADLEAEIFLHLNEYLSDHQKGDVSFPWDKQKSSKENSNLGVNKWKVVTDAAWKIGAKGLESAFLKGGSAFEHAKKEEREI
ncbi:hypothetical protein PR202_ga15684 [Eleusine coracana subsp. coracana]|uniref:Uncharacterized protein n=1 Tax=Eleusine coracana subsp. coracana TaxID=191504 RepID=A0AAV5CKA7_ELECO|nr:hypothetical protein PR202_ga15684 [Eleusine coracana subsp. coracana]